MMVYSNILLNDYFIGWINGAIVFCGGDVKIMVDIIILILVSVIGLIGIFHMLPAGRGLIQ